MRTIANASPGEARPCTASRTDRRSAADAEDRLQRAVPVRLRPQVQAVLRGCMTARRKQRAPNTRTVVRLPERALAESILHLAAPLLETLGPAPAPGEARPALETAINIWNAQVLASPFWGKPDPRPLAALREAMCGRQAPPGLADTFELLSA